MKLPTRIALVFLAVIMLTVVQMSDFSIDDFQDIFQVKGRELQKHGSRKQSLKRGLLSKIEHLLGTDGKDSDVDSAGKNVKEVLRAWDITASKCLANRSVINTKWFQALEPKFQHYVLYRHCRVFPMIINHPEKCEEDIHLLIVIKSIITQHDRRELIRKTWGKEQEIDGKKVKTVFLLGAASKEEEMVNHQKLLEYEDHIFKDILQWDFLDSFYNLTLKETHFLKWFSKYCRNVQYVFKGDDDVFVNIPNIIEYLKESPTENLFAGDVMFMARPIRKKTNKYYIPRGLYNKSHYPPYAGGGGFVMDGSLARKLFEASKGVELYPIDDVFLGMCLARLRIKPVKHHAFKTFGLVRDKKSRLNKEPCFFKSMIVVHKLLPPDLVKMWKRINSKLVCTQKYQVI
ncbi:UDP-GlcNAc:betaGal beta-1,3-N-acetylglucosaminyltransferase 7-like [Paramormyrops kingsleyae]|uniref:UDP-GlcNAc:betaGal beta-1,3-N-acetylglucosaminyltransferase 7-like n=1 Tax=Paramormyrops kingsleyae TaxID=1676925 RepID=UPI003B975DD7